MISNTPLPRTGYVLPHTFDGTIRDAGFDIIDASNLIGALNLNPWARVEEYPDRYVVTDKADEDPTIEVIPAATP